MNLIPAELRAEEEALVAQFSVGEGDEFASVRFDPARKNLLDYAGRRALLGLRPEHLSDTVRDGVGARINVPVTMTEVTGADALVFTRLGGTSVVCRLHPRALLQSGASSSPTQRAEVQVDMTHAVLFDETTGMRLS
jgi:ABC-type sugar transport system ATPase subunit